MDLRDITPRQTFAQSLASLASLACKNRSITAALLLLAVLGQACLS